MTTYDFTPLYTTSVGFDRVFDLLENANQLSSGDNWPPYDIEKTGDDKYRISMSVAGFSENEVEVVQEQNTLRVNGSRSDVPQGELLYRGIANRSFRRRFELADYMKVSGANLENGLLKIDLVRELPEEMKPHRIEIRAAVPQAIEAKQIEHQAA